MRFWDDYIADDAMRRRVRDGRVKKEDIPFLIDAKKWEASFIHRPFSKERALQEILNELDSLCGQDIASLGITAEDWDRWCGTVKEEKSKVTSFSDLCDNLNKEVAGYDNKQTEKTIEGNAPNL